MNPVRTTNQVSHTTATSMIFATMGCLIFYLFQNHLTTFPLLGGLALGIINTSLLILISRAIDLCKRKKFNPEVIHVEKMSALQISASEGDIEKLNAAIQQGDQTNELSPLGLSPLALALSPSRPLDASREACIDTLLQRPLPPHFTLSSSIRNMVIFGRRDLLKKLHKRGIDINIRDPFYDQTPIELAQENMNHLEKQLITLTKDQKNNSDLIEMTQSRYSSLKKTLFTLRRYELENKLPLLVAVALSIFFLFGIYTMMYQPEAILPFIAGVAVSCATLGFIFLLLKMKENVKKASIAEDPYPSQLQTKVFISLSKGSH